MEPPLHTGDESAQQGQRYSAAAELAPLPEASLSAGSPAPGFNTIEEENRAMEEENRQLRAELEAIHAAAAAAATAAAAGAAAAARQAMLAETEASSKPQSPLRRKAGGAPSARRSKGLNSARARAPNSHRQSSRVVELA